MRWGAVAFKWKNIIAPLAAMFALIGFLFSKGPKWRARAGAARGEATDAKLDALDAKGELAKERIRNDHDKAVADIERQTEEDQAAIADDSDDAVRLRAEEYASGFDDSSG